MESMLKIITSMMLKGGSGKTTLVRVLASAAIDRGLNVHILDADPDPQAIGWKERFERAPWGHLEKYQWPDDKLTMSAPPDRLNALYEKFDALEEGGCDLLLIDTRPGPYPDTEDLLMASDVALLPTKPEQADFLHAKQSFEWFLQIVETLKDKSQAPEFRSVLSAVPSKMLSVLHGDLDIKSLNPRDREVLLTITQLPHLNTVIPVSKYWADIAAWGPLGVATATAASQPKGGLQASNMRDLMAGADALLTEVLAVAASEVEKDG